MPSVDTMGVLLGLFFSFINILVGFFIIVSRNLRDVDLMAIQTSLIWGLGFK